MRTRDNQKHSSPRESSRQGRPSRVVVVLWVGAIIVLTALLLQAGPNVDSLEASLSVSAMPHGASGADWRQVFPPSIIITLVLLVILSAFFSSSETAFMSIPKPRIRGLREEGGLTGWLVANMLEHPGSFLTTVLVGNTIVNITIGVVLGTRMKDLMESVFLAPPALAYTVAAFAGTGVLVLLGDIIPKVIAVRTHEPYARATVFPLLLADRLLAPLRNAMLWITDQLFRVTRFHELHAAPYITDDELAAMLARTGHDDKVEDEGRQMIRRILEFHDVQLREILVPRPDVIALPEDATVAEAIQVYHEHEYSRLPVYKDDLDHITGILFAKDLIPPLTRGDNERRIKTLARPPHFVPETMSVQRFIKDVQRLRSHLAIVVDEYGGTEGIVTLHDAVEQIVGAIRDEFDEEQKPYEQIAEGVYRVAGGFALDDLEELTGVELGETEHQTVAGFLMDRTEKMPQVGDRIEHAGITFLVEQVQGKRASLVHIDCGRIEPAQRPPAEDAQ